jgi:hypothetical protein
MKNTILWAVCAFLLLSSVGCISFSPVAIDEKPSIKIDENLVGIWKMREDTNSHDYFVVENSSATEYSVCYMNRGGDNRVFEHNPAFFSEVNGTKLLNVYYRDFSDDYGYFFLKVLAIDHNGFEMTAVALSDTMMKHMKTSKDVRKRIADNINNTAFYKDTLHFRKKLPLRVCK